MKTFAILFVVFALPALVSAQSKLKSMDNEGTTSETSTDYISPNQTTVCKNNTTPVQQSTGRIYTENELTCMSRRDINSVAATVAGVDSRPGTNEIPIIRGAPPSGTAYFVDGVRIYGACPILTQIIHSTYHVFLSIQIIRAC